MGKLLSWFYFIVGLLCTVGMFASFYLGQYVLSSWLFLAIFINFLLFQAIRKEEEIRRNKMMSDRIH
ncbi:hypothetical protein [Fervidibacillus halotolerans]|uniref:Uncharacterized protein n=1 Tax=Fervidibacillus halotolerans TaxID=2980027 RepID=A0A9E8LZM0_9BACI|nr:hypothetical protein [Fervidibacillus halotolerans]WAA12486.1 hypothetical protein OE105_13330 [Fervidibacillus halotolerans]